MLDRTFFLVGMVAAAEAFSAARFPSAADIERENVFRQMPAFAGHRHIGGETSNRGKEAQGRAETGEKGEKGETISNNQPEPHRPLKIKQSGASVLNRLTGCTRRGTSLPPVWGHLCDYLGVSNATWWGSSRGGTQGGIIGQAAHLSGAGIVTGHARSGILASRLPPWCDAG